MKILFVYHMPDETNWMDGLFMALEHIGVDHTITMCNLAKTPEIKEDQEFDFLLGWGAFNSPVDIFLQNIKAEAPTVKIGICIAGNSFEPKGADKYDVLFYETKWYRSHINFHPNIYHAFGINSDLFNKPNIPFPIVWDYIGVGALASWKRWEHFKDKKGTKLVVGEYQQNNIKESARIALDLIENNVMVSNQVHPFDLANFYHWSRTLYVPADVNGGGERAILEARACGLQVEIEEDNPKLIELLDCPIYDEKYYAKQLLKGIQSVL